MSAAVMEHKTVAVEWKAADDGTLRGYASTFGNVDQGGDVVLKGAFAKTLGDLRAAGGIPLLADHTPSTGSVLGTIISGREDSHGLLIEAVFSAAASAQEVRTKLVEGHLSKLSIGYEAMDFAYEDRDGQRIRLLKEVKLWETSVVVFPMNTEASVTSAKGRSVGALDIDLMLAQAEVQLALALAEREDRR